MAPKAGYELRETRAIGTCEGCRWLCTYQAGEGSCMLEKGEERCRFYGTVAAWSQMARGTAAGRWILDGKRKRPATAEEREALGDVTELHLMRLGVARFHLAQAAATLDKPGTEGRLKAEAPELFRVLHEITAALIQAEDWLYELQGEAAMLIRRAG